MYLYLLCAHTGRIVGLRLKNALFLESQYGISNWSWKPIILRKWLIHMPIIVELNKEERKCICAQLVFLLFKFVKNQSIGRVIVFKIMLLLKFRKETHSILTNGTTLFCRGRC